MIFIVNAMETKKKIKLLEALLTENELTRKAIVRNADDPFYYIATSINLTNRLGIKKLLSKLKSEQR